MAVIVCRIPTTSPFLQEKERNGAMPSSPRVQGSMPIAPSSGNTPSNSWKFDTWSAKSSVNPSSPYVHPLTHRSMSQRSLEMCTENLGSETGSDGFSSSFSFNTVNIDDKANGGKNSLAVSHHCSKTPPRSFPPPLRSLSDGPRLQMRPLRKDGRLILEAVPAPAQNYLHARRQDGRLVLSFVGHPIVELGSPLQELKLYEQEQEEEEVEETPTKEKKLCFQKEEVDEEELCRSAPTTTSTTKVAEAGSGSTITSVTEVTATVPSVHFIAEALDQKREELLHHVWRCSQLRRPLFLLEARRIATL